MSCFFSASINFDNVKEFSNHIEIQAAEIISLSTSRVRFYVENCIWVSMDIIDTAVLGLEV